MTRTREALRAAFVRLLLERRYDQIKVADILAEANVGKSTFYEHFRSKDELLALTMDGLIHGLAEAALDRDSRRLEGLLDHFWANRRLGRVVFGPPLVLRLRRILAEAIERRAEGGSLMALQIAAGQLALLHGWLSGEVGAGRTEVAAALRRIARS